MSTAVKLSTEKLTLQDTIDALLLAMAEFQPHDSEYATMVDQLDTLYKLKEVDSKQRVSRDTWAIVAGNLAAVLMIVTHERAHVVTSKALSFVMKLR